jgi:hypothetical protein
VSKLTSVERWVTFDCYGTLIDWNGGLAGRPEHWLNVSLPKGRLLGRVDETTMRHNDATARLAEAAKAAGDKTWGTYALSDLAAQQDELRRIISPGDEVPLPRARQQGRRGTRHEDQGA